MVKRIDSYLVILSLLFITGLAWSDDDKRPDRSSLNFKTFNAEFRGDGIEPEEGKGGYPWKGSQIEPEDLYLGDFGEFMRGNPDIVSLGGIDN